MVRERRKIQEEEVLKLRMLQTVKWDIVRAKEKDMLANLQKLKRKQSKMQRWLSQMTLYSTLVHLHGKFVRLRDQKRLY